MTLGGRVSLSSGSIFNNNLHFLTKHSFMNVNLYFRQILCVIQIRDKLFFTCEIQYFQPNILLFEMEITEFM